MDPRSPPEAEIQSLINLIRKPSKPQLQNICTLNGLPKTGNKADLQLRITQLINDAVRKQDNRRYQEVRQSIYTNTGSQRMAPPYYPANPPQPIPTLPPSQHYGAASFGSPAFSLTNGQRPPVPAPPVPLVTAHRPAAQPRPAAVLTPGFDYRPSPFYDMKRRLGDIKPCEVMSQHRNSVSFTVKACDFQECQADPSLRVMVFCSAGNTGLQDIAFPHQSELKVNGGEIKANLRGLKNKAGSTRPVDITDALRVKPPTYGNTIEFTYALTSKNQKYYLCLVVCKSKPVEALVGMIQKKIRKESVIAELTKKAHDPDIEATSLNLSLKCPLSYMRLSHPCRALSCSHIQCFDATSYLQLQEQGPQWLCPICNKSAPFDQLAVDEYVREILAETSDSVDQVTIDPYGKWSVPGAPGIKREARSESKTASFFDDDDIVISSFSKGASINLATPNRTGAPTAISILGTPNTNNSRDSSVAARSGSKRPAAEVIDLTLSDDDDDDQQRPVKRANYGHNGFQGALY